jgi:hypothetical protein
MMGWARRLLLSWAELYSVMVHIGAAGSGQHYAYIKSFLRRTGGTTVLTRPGLCADDDECVHARPTAMYIADMCGCQAR